MKNLIKVLEKAADKKLKDFKKYLASKNKNATGNLINTSNYVLKVNADKGELLFEVDANDYLKFIESGRKPNSKFPPKKPIIDWMKARGIDEKLQYIICKSIAKNGIKPVEITEIVFSDDEINKLTKQIEEAYQKDLEELTQKAIKKFSK